MDAVSVTDHRVARMIAAYLDGAESGMVEVRGYGLTADEREDAEQEAFGLYGETATT